MLGSGRPDWRGEIRETERALKRGGLAPDQADALRHRLGVALFEAGDLTRAEQELTRVISARAIDPAGAMRQADAIYRLGLIHRLRRRVGPECEAFAAAAVRFEALGLHECALRCLRERCWSLLLAGELAAALPGLARLQAAGPVGAALAVDLGILQALVLLQDKRGADAQQLCLELLGRPPLAPAQRADIAWILGEAALAAGQPAIAAFHAAIAHSSAIGAWCPLQMERVAALTARISAGGGGPRWSSPQG